MANNRSDNANTTPVFPRAKTGSMREQIDSALPMEPYNYRLVLGLGIVQVIIGAIFSIYYTSTLVKFISVFRVWHLHKLVSLITGLVLVICGVCGIVAGRPFKTNKKLSQRLAALLAAFILSGILTIAALYFIVVSAATTIRRDTHYGADHAWYLAKDIGILSLDIVSFIVSLAQTVTCRISWGRLKAVIARNREGQEYIAVNQRNDNSV